jgi:hypothetical protein|tara:strand:- start:2527 stop:2766 length:240 start_codon:yes stop_codon:yes gene_type:complete
MLTSNVKIKRANELLHLIAAGLNQHKQVALCNLEVALLCGGEEVLVADVQTVLDYLANDIYWNEDGDWSSADTAVVRSL